VLEIISAMPLAAMEPGATSSACHASDVEEEDSPLQQSAGSPSHHTAADQYPEDSALEAEETTEGEAIKEVAADEDIDDGGPDIQEPEQFHIKLLGSWEKCKIKDNDVLALEGEALCHPKQSLNGGRTTRL
jgi:hypothetical protein